MTDPLILTDVRGEGSRRTGLITLNRPKQLNALNDALMDELGAVQRDEPGAAAAVTAHVGQDQGVVHGGLQPGWAPGMGLSQPL